MSDEIVLLDQSFDSHLEVISWRDRNTDCLEMNCVDGEEAKRTGTGMRTRQGKRMLKICFQVPLF